MNMISKVTKSHDVNIKLTIGIIMGEQLDVILLCKVFHLLRNDAASRQIHLIYTRLHLTDAHANLLTML